MLEEDVIFNFVLHTVIIIWNDAFQYYKTNKNSLCWMILQNAFMTPE